jgi:hypothetical protein
VGGELEQIDRLAAFALNVFPHVFASACPAQSVGGALALVVHTAYHLGEIRPALCVIKQL